MLQGKERDILRTLVNQYMEFATLPVQKEKIRLWKALNRSQMERPMVTIDQLPWPELMNDDLACKITDPYWRGVEWSLREAIYKWKNFPVDMVLDPFIPIPKAMVHTGYGLAIEQETMGAEDSTAKSYHFTNQLKSIEDVQKIKDYHITHDEAQTAQRLAEAKEMFGDIAPAMAMGHTFHIGVWDYISQLMSVEECYYAFVDDPDLLHAAMDRITNATIAAIEDANKCGVHNDNANICHCSYTYTDELLPDSGAGKGPYSQNSWAFGLAQLFTAVSPELFEEFELPYVTRMAKYFGMIYYGCCDRLDDRLDIVKRIPNVRKVSCSPWSDRENFAQNIGTELIMSNKPTPAYLATVSFDEDVVREDLKRTCDLARQNNVNLEFLLKDISTVKNDPSRLTRWAEVAMSVVENY